MKFSQVRARSDFHYALLQSVSIEWGKRQCIISIETASSFFEIRLSAIRHVTVPYLEPWGPSSHVNKFHFTDPSHLEIEMQSGDRLNFEAESYEYYQALE